MIRGDWGKPERVWGLEPYYDPGRMIQIYEAIKDLNIKRVVDVACGVGLIAEGLSWVIPYTTFQQFDIEEYPEWQHLRVKPTVRDLNEFIKTDESFDLVLMLNSYRNWDDEPRGRFNEWLSRNAKYFISSGIDGKVIGKDVKGHDLVLKTL